MRFAARVVLPTSAMPLDDLNALREGWDFEAKLAGGRDGRGAVPASLWETYAAMANTVGGRILLGARELEDGTLDPVGIVDVEKVETDLWNQLNDRTKVSANLLTREMVNRIEVAGVVLLQIDIPKADRARLPVHLNGSFQHNTFVRIGSGDRRADMDTVRRLVADSDPHRDSRPLPDYKLEDLDSTSLRHFREVFLARRRGHAFGATDGIEFLTQLQAWAQDRKTGEAGPTRAGLLMFGRELAIRELYPHWHLSYQERDPMIERWVDRVWPDGNWEANVYNFYLRVYNKLVAGVKVPFALDANMFRVDETDVHRALREAFINTLVHADYAGRGGLRIIRERGGYVFKNPGLPLVDVEQIWRGGVSVSRNPTLLKLFALVELGEREGSGGPAIRNAWRAQHWQAPALRLDVQNAETHLELSQASLLPEFSVEVLTAEWGAEFTGLDDLGRIALSTAHAEGKVSHARLRELSDLHPRELTLTLHDLVQKNMLEPLGKGSGRSYRLCAAPPRIQTELTFGDVDAASSSPRSSSSSPRTSSSPPRSSPSSTSAEAAASDDDVVVVQVASTRWVHGQELRLAILALCRAEFYSLAEITAALNRTINAVRSHVRDLVEEGLLEQLHPGQRSHPRQAYRTRKAAELP